MPEEPDDSELTGALNALDKARLANKEAKLTPRQARALLAAVKHPKRQ